MPDAPAHTVYLKNYAPPAFVAQSLDLHFSLEPAATLVRSRARYLRNPALGETSVPLQLFGRQLELMELRLDGEPLPKEAYRLSPEGLSIAEVPDAFELEVLTRINPRDNTSLEGLYLSSGNFCTQCEAQGFRRITYYPDRPDVMTRFTTTIEADRELYPVLLSNGNLVEQGELEGGRHFARWEDPFKKPSYLFALVAGRLSCLEDSFVTASGRQVRLQIFTEERNAGKCGHAMASLKKAMRWDEQVYGLEYDLDIYMIVAVDDFNMGAMENKGLNVFNSKYVLARQETATDADFQGIEGVIAHEYFHNWTGNRVTCRDWFQLSLKEGLTVFRDQEFSADMTSRAVKRIEEVRLLRNSQFPEDAGPMAHPVRPDSYQEINNFYTVTVYNKGAEVIRMYHRLLGDEGFRKGMDLYFERHDGQAVTTDDFLQAMADANGVDLEQFRLWYSQAGTPLLEASGSYDEGARVYTLRVRQSCPATPGQAQKQPFHIPLSLGLLGPDGRDIPLRLEGEAAPLGTTRVLELRRAEEVFSFVDVETRPVASLLRDFSAPVRLQFECSDAELAFLMAHDSDAFNRWEAAQRLAERMLLALVEDVRAGRELVLPDALKEAFGALLRDESADPALVAQAMILPAEGYLAEQMEQADPDAIHAARQFVRRSLAAHLKQDLHRRYLKCRTGLPYGVDAAQVGLRSLKNLCLAYLSCLSETESVELAYTQFRLCDNMTDAMAALQALCGIDCKERLLALEMFHERWKDDPLVVDKWLSVQALSSLPGTLDEVQALLEHPSFNIRNPNKVRSLIGAFCHSNPVRFHQKDGRGYRFLAERVLELDRLNPQVAARMVGAFNRWRKFDPARQALMCAQLQRISQTRGLSSDVSEIVGKALA